MQRTAAKSNATRAKSADVSQRSQHLHRSPVPAPPHRLPPLQKTPGVPQTASNHSNKPKSASRMAPSQSQLARSTKNASRAKSARSSFDQDSDSGYDDKMSSSSVEDDDDYLEVQAAEEWKAKSKVADEKSHAHADLLTTFERQLLHFERRAMVDSNGHRKRLSHSFADLKARLNHLPVIREEMSIHPQLVEY